MLHPTPSCLLLPLTLLSLHYDTPGGERAKGVDWVTERPTEMILMEQKSIGRVRGAKWEDRRGRVYKSYSMGICKIRLTRCDCELHVGA